MLWDRILDTRRKARVNINGGKPKYEFKEIGGSFRCVHVPACFLPSGLLHSLQELTRPSWPHPRSNVTATFSLRYDVQPWAGALLSGEVTRTEPILLPPLQRRT